MTENLVEKLSRIKDEQKYLAVEYETQGSYEMAYIAYWGTLGTSICN